MRHVGQQNCCVFVVTHSTWVSQWRGERRWELSGLCPGERSPTGRGPLRRGLCLRSRVLLYSDHMLIAMRSSQFTVHHP